MSGMNEPEPQPVLSSESTAAPVQPGSSCGFLRSIFRLLSLRTAATSALTAGAFSIALMILLSIAIWIGVRRWWAGEGVEFYPYSLPALAWYLLIVLLDAWILAHASRPKIEYARVLAGIAAFLPVGIFIWCAQAWRWPDLSAMAASAAVIIYFTLYAARALQSLTGQRQLRAILLSMILLFGAAKLSEALSIDADFWAMPEESSSADSDPGGNSAQWRDAEQVMFDQAERIDTLVGAMQRPADLAAAAFFVGFAGMGEQKVFAGEIALADRLVAQQYGSAQRSIELVNDQRDLTAHPFASATALHRTLLDVAKKMNLEHDVLFLALSSHGSEDATIAVSNGPLTLNDLSAEDLQQALEDSGIRWKVIIVSACFAGSFTESLQDDHTIVITAAAADKTSFGCSNDRDLTYFGESFYRDSLPVTKTLRAAFDRTRHLIAAREKSEHIEASDPQASFGKAIEPYVETLRTSAATSQEKTASSLSP
jgi:hypothetical protein